MVEARGSTGAAEARGRRLAWSTAVFSLATGLSRIVGLLRESVVRYYFGTVGSINAFEVAFLVPNTIRALVADAALKGRSRLSGELELARALIDVTRADREPATAPA